MAYIVINIILTILSLFLGTGSVLAGESPTQTTPTNGSSVSSSSLNWQSPSYSLYSTNPYRVQVDDDVSFGSINKDYYTKNTYYTPALDYDTWYWRVKAKDSSGNWSEWSSIWSFILQASSSSPAPSPSPTPSPSPSSSPSASPTTSSSFTITNITSQTNSDQSFNSSINLSLPNNPTTTFYLKGAFKKTDSSNYFGLTKSGSDWIKNGATYSDQFKITTDSSGNWTGNLEVQPDSEDSGFKGSGDYIFKIARYSSTGSGPTWSNEANIKINSVTSDQGGVSNESTPSPSPNPKSSSSITTIKSTSSSKLPSKELNYQIASIAGESTQSASKSANDQTEVKSQKQINFPIIVGMVLIISGFSSIFYIYLRNKRV